MKQALLFTLTVFYSYLLINALDSNPDIGLTTCQLVQARGLQCIPVNITTYQGYIIELHHIPPLSNSSTSGKLPVILQCGGTSTSADYIMASADVTLDPTVMGDNMGIELAKRGYDVWLSNNRGNPYGMGHISLDPKVVPGPFWDFTLDQMAQYDVPAVIDSVLKLTNSDKLHYVGHSQGSAIIFAFLSQNSTYDTKLASVTTLAPTIYIEGGVTTFPLLIAALTPPLSLFGGKVPVFTRNFLTTTVLPYGCDLEAFQAVCGQIWQSTVGEDTADMDQNRIGVYLSNQPSTISGKNLLQYQQMFATNEFKRYDYGFVGNLQNYGQATAPVYNISSITYPKSQWNVIYGLNEQFAPEEGIELLKTQMTGASFTALTNTKANHFDPLLGITTAIETNNLVLAILDNSN